MCRVPGSVGSMKVEATKLELLPEDRAKRLTKSRFFDVKNIPSYYAGKVAVEASQ